MVTAITREVSPKLAECNLEYQQREPIDITKAVGQHRAYQSSLRELGLDVISLTADSELPDSMFVEDPAIVLDEVAILCRMGAESRRKEPARIASALARFRDLKWLSEPSTLEGGDVMRAGRTLYVGISHRTNREGTRQLAELLLPFGYRVVPIEVTGCLHLKSACCYLGDNTVLANREWIAADALKEFRVLEVEEPGAANVLRIGETVLIPDNFPKTREMLERSGFQVKSLDISELQKAEAGLTCSSLIFEISPARI